MALACRSPAGLSSDGMGIADGGDGPLSLPADGRKAAALDLLVDRRKALERRRKRTPLNTEGTESESWES